MKDADYVIYSVLGNEHWFAPDHSIKIFYTIENLAPDFNACDYAIGFEWMQFEDRYMRFPLYYWYPRINELMENKHHLLIEKIKQESRRYAKRQLTWFRRNKNILHQTKKERQKKQRKP